MAKAPHMNSVHSLPTLLQKDLYLVSWILACTSMCVTLDRFVKGVTISSNRIVPEQLTQYCT